MKGVQQHHLPFMTLPYWFTLLDKISKVKIAVHSYLFHVFYQYSVVIKMKREASTPRCRAEVRKWTHGCYTLLHDTDTEGSEFALDASVFFNTHGQLGADDMVAMIMMVICKIVKHQIHLNSNAQGTRYPKYMGALEFMPNQTDTFLDYLLNTPKTKLDHLTTLNS